MVAEDGSGNEYISLHELIVRSADAGLSLQRDNGSFPAGENYAYGDPETPVRNTARWLIVLCRAYELTDDHRFRTAAGRAVNYLLNDDVRPYGYTFHCRKTTDKDRCNGLVGQAGPIRALTTAGEKLENNAALEAAKEVFSLHPFDDDLGLWERIEIDGQNLSFDRTLNHQILFAAGCADLAKHETFVEERLQLFLGSLPTNMATHDDGLIKHYIRPPADLVIRNVVMNPSHYLLVWNMLVNHYYDRSMERREKELGYQPVNLAALSELHAHFEDFPMWCSDTIDRTIRCLKDNQPKLLSDEGITHGVVMPGTTIARILHEFEGQPMSDLTHLLANDLDRKLNHESFLLNKDTADPVTQAALVSNFVTLPNVQIPLRTDD